MMEKWNIGGCGWKNDQVIYNYFQKIKMMYFFGY